MIRLEKVEIHQLKYINSKVGPYSSALFLASSGLKFQKKKKGIKNNNKGEASKVVYAMVAVFTHSVA